MIKQTSISKTPWTFSPYNQSEWEKSKNRVMFVGAEPNGNKKFKNEEGLVTDMGEWFRRGFEKNGEFYKRTIIMLDEILPHINDEERKNHMRFVDLKITAGGDQADEKDILKHVKHEDFILIVNDFFNSTSYPHYVVFTGNISHAIWKKIKLNKISKVKFNDKSKAVLMPHPNPRFKPSGHKELTLASKSLNINNISNKFKSIMKNLWRWSLNGKWIESK